MDARTEEILGIIGHDLGNRATRIVSSINLLEDEETTTEEQRKFFLETMRKEVLAINEELQSLLSYATRDPSPQPFFLDSAVKNAVDFHEEGLKKKNISLAVERSELWAFGDYKGIEIVIRNLIGNSIKFTEPGGNIVIEINGDDFEITISVVDTGIGIPNHIMENLFSPIRRGRVRESVSGNETGAGLGLVFSKDIVEENKGKIWPVERTLGAKISLTIPRNMIEGRKA